MSDDILLTTECACNDLKISRRLGIVSAEAVMGMNIFRDLFAGIRDIVGGRSGASQNVLRDARETCLDELREQAAALGANAVIAVDIDYNQVSGGGKSMLMVAATGTAVVVER